jgi:hypothetical protein
MHDVPTNKILPPMLVTSLLIVRGELEQAKSRRTQFDSDPVIADRQVRR